MVINIDQMAKLASRKEDVIEKMKIKLKKLMINEECGVNPVSRNEEIDLDSIPSSFSKRLENILNVNPLFVDQLKELFGIFNETEDSRNLLEMNIAQCLRAVDKVQKASKGKLIDKKK